MNIKFKLLKKFPDGNEQEVDWGNLAQPYPAKKGIPDWLTQQPAEYDDGGKTIKKCQPFLDGLTTGYIIPFPDNMTLRLKGKYDFEISGPGGRFISAHGYMQYNNSWFKDRLVIKFNNPWIIETPHNYSSYIFHPNGKNVKPFYTIPAIVDTDCYNLSIALPFVCYENKIGKEIEITKGTPMAQIIPFKREKWQISIEEADHKQWENSQKELWNDPNNFYLKHIKQKKEYN